MAIKKGEIVDDFDTIKDVAVALARERRFAAHWFGCDESEVVRVHMEKLTEQREWRIPTRKELEERVAKYLAADEGYPDAYKTTPYPERASDLVRIFNQWTVEVVAPEVLEQIDN